MRVVPNPGIALLFNIIWPGVGQVYQGRALAGLFLMFAIPVGYLCLVVPGLILHFIALVDAAFYRPKIR
jgi:TM2 domain-containing membrane protein YozV